LVQFDAAHLVPVIILIAIFLLVAFPVHEFFHAFAAYRLGDGTAKMFGRLTLNPLVHFDPLGGLLLIVSVLSSGFVFGWAKPTPVNPSNLRDRRNSEVIVALAGPASNLVMACAAALVFRALDATGLLFQLPEVAVEVLFDFVLFNILLAIFNMIPIPPLDGSTLLWRFLPPQMVWQWRPILSQYGFIILLVFIFTIGRFVAGLVYDVTSFLVGF
jgi:Zn-dependent protease